MSQAVSVLNPGRQVKLTAGMVEVRELRAVDALALFRQLGEHAGKFMDEQGNLSITLNRLVDLIGSTEELAVFVVEKSTSLKRDEFLQLGMGDTSLLLAEIAEVNLSEDILKNAARLKGCLMTAFGRTAPRTPSPSHSTSS